MENIEQMRTLRKMLVEVAQFADSINHGMCATVVGIAALNVHDEIQVMKQEERMIDAIMSGIDDEIESLLSE